MDGMKSSLNIYTLDYNEYYMYDSMPEVFIHIYKDSELLDY